ncbi:MAG: LPS export ABC transporter periplasmic protein LptC [Bacteroidota bacterium]
MEIKNMIRFGCFILGLLLLCMACQNELIEVGEIDPGLEPGVERAKEVEMLYSDSGVVRVRIKAPLLYFYQPTEQEGQKREFPEGLKVDFFNPNKQVTSWLIANYARHHEKSGLIYLRDSVVVWNIKNERIISEEMVWDEKNKQIRSDTFVTVITEKEEIFGRNLIANQEFTRWEIKDVEGIVELESMMGEDPTKPTTNQENDQ